MTTPISIQYRYDLDLNQNELQNVKGQNLGATPANVVESQFWYDSTGHTMVFYNGTSVIDMGSQGITADFTGADGTNAGTHGLVPAPSATDNTKFLCGDGTWGTPTDTTYTFDTGLTTNGTTISVTDYAKLIKNKSNVSDSVTILGTGTNQSRAINIGIGSDVTTPGGIAIGNNAKVVAASNGIQLGYGTNNGFTGLQVYSYPLLDGTTGYIPDARLNMDSTPTSASTHTVTSGGVYTALSTKIDLTSLSIDSGSTNYLGYDNSTGKFSAKVDTTVGTVSTNLVTSGAVSTALGNKLDKKPDGTNNLIDSNNKITTTYLPDVVLGQMLYAGTFQERAQGVIATLTTNAKTKLGTSSDTITLTNDTTAITGYTANEGCYYICSEDSDFANISFKTGDWLVSTGSGWTKVDNTDAVTGVKGNAESTYRIGNVNITADNVLPTQTSNSGKFLTTDGTNCSWATVDALPSQTSQSGKFLTTDGTTASWANAVTPTGTQTLTNKTINADNNTISDLTTSNLKAGVLQTTVRGVSSASDTALASEKAIATAISTKAIKLTANNTALTPSSGVCTWTITNSISSADLLIGIYEVSTNAQVFAGVTVTSSTITIKMNSSSTIAADTYKMVAIGV